MYKDTHIKILTFKEYKLKEYKFQKIMIAEENRIINKLPKYLKLLYVAKLNNR